MIHSLDADERWTGGGQLIAGFAALQILPAVGLASGQLVLRSGILFSVALAIVVGTMVVAMRAQMPGWFKCGIAAVLSAEVMVLAATQDPLGVREISAKLELAGFDRSGGQSIAIEGSPGGSTRARDFDSSVEDALRADARFAQRAAASANVRSTFTPAKASDLYRIDWEVVDRSSRWCGKITIATGSAELARSSVVNLLLSEMEQDRFDPSCPPA